MDLYELNLLTFNERAQLIWEQGNLLTIRCTSDYSISLYHMGKFFTEVWYERELDKITHVRAFKSQKCLEPYLDQIQLDSFSL